MSNELIQTIVYGVLVPILPVLTAYLVQVLRAMTKEAKNNIHSNIINKYITIAEDAVSTAVVSVSQTYVDSLKVSGTFDPAAQKEAFEKARLKALAIMGEAAKETIEATYGDLNIWVDNKIEYYIGIYK